jgi:tetratricopeptide (TPR) repeat protein
MRTLSIILFLFILGCHSKSERDQQRIDSFLKAALKADSLGNSKEAILQYGRVLDIDSLNLIALINRGKELVFTSDAQKGLADYNKAVRKWPDERTYYRRALAFIYLSKPDSARKDLESATKLNPRFADAYYGYASLYMSEEDYFLALYQCELGDKYGKNESFSKSIHTELSKKISPEVVSQFNYDRILQNVRDKITFGETAWAESESGV